jgi:hypothetical protein
MTKWVATSGFGAEHTAREIDMNDVVREATRLALINVDSNVIHRFNCWMDGAIQASLSAMRQDRIADDDSQFRVKLREDAESLRFYCTRFSDAVDMLSKEIERSNDIIPSEVTTTLMDMHCLLRLATENFERLTVGIEAWASRSFDCADREPFLVDGEKVLSTLDQARKSFKALEEKVSSGRR